VRLTLRTDIAHQYALIYAAVDPTRCHCSINSEITFPAADLAEFFINRLQLRLHREHALSQMSCNLIALAFADQRRHFPLANCLRLLMLSSPVCENRKVGPV
jgi:hypothetical protein